MTKTPEQAAEEYSQIISYIGSNSIGSDPRSDIREIIEFKRGQNAGFLAGRKHFIESELRELLNSLKDKHTCKCDECSGETYGDKLHSRIDEFVDEIIQKALEKK